MSGVSCGHSTGDKTEPPGQVAPVNPEHWDNERGRQRHREAPGFSPYVYGVHRAMNEDHTLSVTVPSPPTDTCTTPWVLGEDLGGEGRLSSPGNALQP